MTVFRPVLQLLTAALLAASCITPSSALAVPTGPVSIELPPEDQGAIFSPGVRLVADLPQDYVEEEFFISGTADLYNYAHNPPLDPTDIETVETSLPYKTRIIVRRPVDHKDFNGSVVIEWWNSTANFDTAPVWDPSAEYFAREGYVYVGFTNANQSLVFLTGGCSLLGILPPTCGTRYESLSLPDDGLVWDVASQLANLLRSESDQNPLPGAFRVERVYHSGQSQQGGSIVTYASGFHAPGVNDGYFVQANIWARRINDDTSCDAPGADDFPDCRPLLQGDDAFVRRDLPVPVVQALTETDVVELFGTAGRQPDAPNYRYYEMAGTAHMTVHEGTEIIPDGVLNGPIFLSDLCDSQMNSIADGPVFGSYLYNAMWENLDRQVRRRRKPPAGVVLDLDAAGEVARDEHGNALGGIRLPAIEVPIASYNPPTNKANPTLPALLKFIGNLACYLSGSVTPFSDEKIEELYPNRGQYVSKVARAANDLQRQGFLLREDRWILFQRSVH